MLWNPSTCTTDSRSRLIDSQHVSGPVCSFLQVFEMLVNPGDNVLLDAPTYSGTLATVREINFFKQRTHSHTSSTACNLVASSFPVAWATRLQPHQRFQRPSRHDTRSPEGGSVSVGPLRGPQARQHRPKDPLHHPQRRKPYRCLHDDAEETGSVWGSSSLLVKPWIPVTQSVERWLD